MSFLVNSQFNSFNKVLNKPYSPRSFSFSESEFSIQTCLEDTFTWAQHNQMPSFQQSTQSDANAQSEEDYEDDEDWEDFVSRQEINKKNKDNKAKYSNIIKSRYFQIEYANQEKQSNDKLSKMAQEFISNVVLLNYKPVEAIIYSIADNIGDKTVDKQINDKMHESIPNEVTDKIAQGLSIILYA